MAQYFHQPYSRYCRYLPEAQNALVHDDRLGDWPHVKLLTEGIMSIFYRERNTIRFKFTGRFKFKTRLQRKVSYYVDNSANC